LTVLPRFSRNTHCQWAPAPVQICHPGEWESLRQPKRQQEPHGEMVKNGIWVIQHDCLTINQCT
jgi:hypothetical protein